MPGYCFLVGKNPVCYWDDDSHKTNLRALEFLNPQFFLNAAQEFWSQKPISEYNDPRIDHLVIQYWIGMEAALSLIAALLQAPQYFYGWIVSSSSPSLDYVLDAIRQGEDIRYAPKTEPFEWLSVAQTIFSGIDELQFLKNHARIWHTISAEYLAVERREAYNRIKHGFGARKNAISTITIGDMTLKSAGGKFGHHFFDLERIEDSKQNLSLVEKIVNWDPTHCIQSIEYVGMSLHNIKQVLKARFTKESGTLDLFVPSDEITAEFENGSAAGQKSTVIRLEGVTYCSPLPTKAEIRSKIAERGSRNAGENAESQ